MAAGTHTFTSGPTTFTFATGNVYPVRTTRRRAQAMVVSAGGEMYVQDKATKSVTEHELVWAGMSSADFASLKSFIVTTMVFANGTLTWNDLDNADHTVRVVNNPFEATEVAAGVFAVTLTLREET